MPRFGSRDHRDGHAVRRRRSRSTSTARRTGPLAGRARQRRAGAWPAPPARARCSPTTSRSSCGGPCASAVDVPARRRARGTNDTAHSVELTRQAAAAGVDGVLVSRRTTTGRRRPGSRPTSGPSPRPPTCRSCSTTSRPHRPQDRHDAAAAPGPRGPQHRRPQGRGRRPGRDGPAGRRGARRLRGLQRRRRAHAAAAGGRRGRRRSAWPRTGPAGDGRDGRRVRARATSSAARELNAAARVASTSRPATRTPNPHPAKAMLRALGLPVGPVPAAAWARRPTGSSERAPRRCSSRLVRT